MLCHRTNDTDATLSFWREAARRLNLDDIDAPVTAETLDRLLKELREVSQDKIDQDYPFVPSLIRLFAVHDDEFFRLLDGYGERTLDPRTHQSATELMKRLPGLWAMAAEIKMTRSRLGWMASADEVRRRLDHAF
jgi:hypothetical protein